LLLSMPYVKSHPRRRRGQNEHSTELTVLPRDTFAYFPPLDAGRIQLAKHKSRLYQALVFVDKVDPTVVELFCRSFGNRCCGRLQPVLIEDPSSAGRCLNRSGICRTLVPKGLTPGLFRRCGEGDLLWITTTLSPPKDGNIGLAALAGPALAVAKGHCKTPRNHT